MGKRYFALLLVAVMLLPLFTGLLPTVEAVETDELKQAIAEQYDAFAASIYQSNAHNAAVKQLLNHSIDHPGQFLEMDESDPFTASLFQSALFREYVIETSTKAVEIMHSEQEDRLIIGGAYVSWHDFALEYGARVFDYTDGELPEVAWSGYSQVIPNTIYTGPSNQNDKAMILVVGSARGWLRFNQTSVDAEQITYRVEVTLKDDFDFSGEYSAATAKGFDTSTSMLLTLVGRLFLNEYSWSASASFDLTVPNLCSHDKQTENYRWEFNGTELYAVTGEGLTENPLTPINYTANDGTSRTYYQIRETVRLYHERPWTVEFRMAGYGSFIMSRGENGWDTGPFLCRGLGDYVFGGQYFITPVDEEDTNPIFGMDLHGIRLKDHNCYISQMNTYRLENRIAEDGTNMVYLIVNGEELGPMNNAYYWADTSIGASSLENLGKTDGWFTGTDFGLNYIFNIWQPYKDSIDIEYIQVWENGQDAEPYTYYTFSERPATCTEAGGVVRNCLFCGASYLEEVTEAALGHCWNEGAVTVAPGCTEEGVMSYTCVNDSSHARTESIPAVGHTPVIDGAVDASCTADGLTEGSHCGTCGTVLAAQEVVPAVGHCWDGGVVTTRPGVNGVGVMTYTCTACGEMRAEEVPYDPQVVRLAGENRFETAILVAERMKAELGISEFDTIIVASGSNFADALSGSYLAAVKNAPILLSYNDKYNEMARAYIRENLAPGGTVYILGGTAAVSADMEIGLENFRVIRLAGADRFETNLAILEEAGVGDQEILVCTGVEFADSLSASALKKPILLVWKELTVGQKDFLKGLENSFCIIGGENAVSRGLAEEISAYGETRRIGGANRFETSVLIAEEFFDAPESVVLAYAWNYPDGLCGGALAAAMDAPLILTMEKYESQAAEYIQEQPIREAIILGGEGLIPDTSVHKLLGQ